MANTPTTAVGLFKDLYRESGLIEAIPTWAVLQDRYKFQSATALGRFFVCGVTLTKEHGATYAPSSGTGSGAVTLNAVVAANIERAEIEGFAIYFRSRLSYDAAAKAATAGKRAFAQAYTTVLKNLKESHQFRLELSLLYGRDGIGVVAANSSGTFTITTASWATGIWAAGMRNCVLEVFSGTGPSVTQRNADMTITSVNITNRTVTVSGTSAAVVANDVIYFKSARTASAYNECIGLFRILSNTGTMFNINGANYDAWRGSSYPVNGNVNLTAVMQAAAVGMNYGLQGKALCAVNPDNFAQFAVDEAALRRFVSQQDMQRPKRGAKGITFMLGNIDVEVLVHPLVQLGHFMMWPEAEFMRLGSTDITFGMPGTDEPMEVHVTDSTALEMRSMSDQAAFLEVPARGVLGTGITQGA